MTKKRTSIPFYGKTEQARESIAMHLARQGQFKDATKMITDNSAAMKAKREAPVSRLAPWVGPAILPDGTRGRWQRGEVVPRRVQS